MKRAVRFTLAVVTIFAALYLPACSGEPKIAAAPDFWTAG
jgi:hypothetical protein